MGDFDFGSSYPDYTPSLTKLIKELLKENYKISSDNDMRKKFKDSHESGIIDKLNKVGFDIEHMASNDKEKFDMLKILKALYKLEKEGKLKKDSYGYTDKGIKVTITDLFAKPRLENIKTVFSEASRYGNIFKELLQNVRKEVNDADWRDQILVQISVNWERLINKIFDYVVTNKSLSDPETSLRERGRIKNFFVKILDKLPGTVSSSQMNNEGVMKSFYNYLVCHQVICCAVDAIRINYQICIEPPPDKNYIEKYKACEKKLISWEDVDILTELILKGKHSRTADYIMQHILYEPEKAYNPVPYRFALKYYRTVLGWCMSNQHDENGEPFEPDISKGINFAAFIAIIQEMAFVAEHKVKYTNDYVGYPKSGNSLTAAVKNGAEAPAIAVKMWTKRIENRVSVNLGSFEQIKKKREIEAVIYEIKQKIFGYHHIDDIQFVNDVIFKFVSRSIFSNKVALDFGQHFMGIVKSKIKSNAKEYTVEPIDNTVGFINFFKEVQKTKYPTILKIALCLAAAIDKVYLDKTDERIIYLETDFTIINSKNHKLMYIIRFVIDKNKKKILIDKFIDVRSEQEIIRMKELGLSEFVKEL